MNLSKFERYLLSNQLRILEKLDDEYSDSYSRTREILENGYEYLYSDAFRHIVDGNDVMSENECKEVWDTLDMFEGISRSSEQFLEPLNDEVFSKFRGYDGNSESKFLGFVEFTVNRERRWTYLPLARENYFNSHMAMRDIYARMLEEWRKVGISSRYKMNLETVTKILDAAIHPENR